MQELNPQTMVTTLANPGAPEDESDDEMPPVNFTPGLIEDGPKLYKVSQGLFLILIN